MKHHLSVRIGIASGLLILGALMVSYLLVQERLSTIYADTVRTELYRVLMLGKARLENQTTPWRNNKATTDWVNRTGMILNLRITIIDPSGKVLFDSSVPSNQIASLPNHAKRQEIRQALEKGYGESIRFSQTVREHALYMAVQVGRQGNLAILRYSKPLFETAIFDSILQKESLFLLIIAIIFALISGFFASAIMTAPLRQIADAIRKSVKEPPANIPQLSERSDEIGIIARTVGQISEELITIKQREEWYKAVFSGIREAIIVTNASGNITMLNPAASSMLNIKGSLFTPRALSVLPDKKLQELFEAVHANRQTLRRQEIQLLTTRGERITQISSMPLMNQNEFGGTVYLLNDITTLRNLERIRRDFVSSVSHELRTPLSIISGYTETLLEGAMNDPNNAIPFLRTIHRASEQLTALVNDVLDLSKIESGYIEYKFEPVALEQLIASAIELLKSPINQKQIRLNVSIQPGLPPLSADPRYLDIAIRNLLDNAIKYVEREGRIRISAFKNNNNIQIDIEDNGVGIPKADLERIFERFYRVDKARSGADRGTGLGLAIVKHIILAHQGDIQVHSRVNEGSTFSLILKAATKPDTTTEPAT